VSDDVRKQPFHDLPPVIAKTSLDSTVQMPQMPHRITSPHPAPLFGNYGPNFGRLRDFFIEKHPTLDLDQLTR
jgi:hypothetical protein